MIGSHPGSELDHGEQERFPTAAVTIQRHVRGMLARQLLFPAYIMENKLEPELLEIAERQLSKGNIWGFLKDVQGEIDRMKAEMEFLQKREEEFAETFIDKVIATREEEIKEAWRKYLQAMEGLQKNGGPKINLDKLKQIDPNLRRMADGSPLTSKFQTHTLGPNLNQLCNSNSFRPDIKPIALSRPSHKDVDEISGITLRSSISFSEPHDDHTTSTTRVLRPTKKDANANDGEVHVVKNGKIRSRPLFTGEAVTRELGAGLDDTIEKLMRSAILRSFVPSTMPSDTSPEEAFASYCNAAPSLAKVKHEHEAFLIAKEYALAMKSQGFFFIRQLLPFIESEEFFTRFGMSEILISSISNVIQVLQGVTMLKKYGKVEVMKKYKLLSDARRFLARSANGPGSFDCEILGEGTHPDTDDKRTIHIPERAPTEIQSPKETYDVALRDPETDRAHLFHANILKALYEDEQNWGSLHDPIDNLLAIAAFFILPGPSAELGPSAFTAFVEHLSALHGQEDLHHTALKSRYENAKLFAEPYLKRLKAVGIKTVKDLQHEDLLTWGFPAPYYKQLQDMTSKIFAKDFYIDTSALSDDRQFKCSEEPFRSRLNYISNAHAKRPSPLRKTMERSEQRVQKEEEGSQTHLLRQALKSSNNGNDGRLLGEDNLKFKVKGPPRRSSSKSSGRHSCSFKGCHEQFTYLHTFKLHEKAHQYFDNPSNWGNLPEVVPGFQSQLSSTKDLSFKTLQKQMDNIIAKMGKRSHRSCPNTGKRVNKRGSDREKVAL